MRKPDIKMRRYVGAICSRCQSPDYSLVEKAEQQIKPEFKCGSCGNTWQYGRDGGKYLVHL
jgi:transposase-like protein